MDLRSLRISLRALQARNRLSGNGTVLDGGEGNVKAGMQAYVEPQK